jgi:outer membrane lipoprotein SlyB
MIKRVIVVALAGVMLAGCSNTSTLSGDTYSASEAKQVQSVSYGTLVSVRPVKIQGGDESNVIGAIGGAVLGGVAGQGVQGAVNKTDGVELEIRKDDGNTIMVVQKQAATRYSVGQRVVMASNGSQVTVSPR